MKDPKELAKELTPAVNAYLLARTFAECEREKVDAIQQHLLNTASYFTADEHNNRGMKKERITDPKYAWLMAESEFHEYWSDVRKALEDKGYVIQPAKDAKGYWDYYCPACTAESLQNDTEHLIVDQYAELQGEEEFLHRLICAGMETYHKFIDLTVGFVVNSPGFVPPEIKKGAAVCQPSGN
jgi:hypothetical protein